MFAAGGLGSAVALDAADGVLDGRFYGAPIGVTNPYTAVAPAATYPSAYPAFGAPAVATPSYGSALALDAADGVIDGRFYGSKIGVASQGFSAYGAMYGATAVATPSYGSAMALDAADGVIDGRFFGSKIGVAAPVYRTPYAGYGYGLTAATSALAVGAYPAMGAFQAVYPSIARPAVQYAQYIAPQPVQYIAQPPQVQVIQAPPQIQYIQSPPQIQYIQSPPEVRYIESPPQQVPVEDPKLLARIRELEAEIAMLRAKLSAKAEVRSQTTVNQTYKVKSFDIAAKLAVMDGTDDGLYNGLPIEVEGEGLYRDLVAAGRRPRANVSLTGRATGSMTTTSETYKVQSFEMAEKLSKMDGTDDGKYNGLPIEVAGQGLYTDLVRARRGAGWGR